MQGPLARTHCDRVPHYRAPLAAKAPCPSTDGLSSPTPVCQQVGRVARRGRYHTGACCGDQCDRRCARRVGGRLSVSASPLRSATQLLAHAGLAQSPTPKRRAACDDRLSGDDRAGIFNGGDPDPRRATGRGLRSRGADSNRSPHPADRSAVTVFRSGARSSVPPDHRRAERRSRNHGQR
jgi:hypothetical protein